MNLPKPHLSFSQITLWINSPETYRKKYYPDTTPPFRQSIEMKFGNEVTEAMERNEPWTDFIPRYPVFEQKLLVDIDGVPVLMFVDNMNTKTVQFAEQKTGRTPWTQNKVNKHLQLEIYSLGLQIHFGKIEDECFHVWVKTKKVEEDVIAGGEKVGTTYKIELTGEYEMFSRIITQEDRDNCRSLIVRVAKEIEEDYKALAHLYR